MNLASRALGAGVMVADDELFGAKEDLLLDAPARVDPGRYGHKGELVDGWETRRRRTPGHDWVVIRLGAPGVVTAVDIDTTGFDGNPPVDCLVEGAGAEGHPSVEDLAQRWTTIVPRGPVRGDAHNHRPVSDPRRWTHIRLSIFPDGGVARLRVFGDAVPDPCWFDDLTPDLASSLVGGRVVAGSDPAGAAALLEPFGGWLTGRRAGPDWALLQLAAGAHVQAVEVDTRGFGLDASTGLELWGWSDPAGPGEVDDPGWVPLGPALPLLPDILQRFRVAAAPTVAWVRLTARPQAGIGRVRLFGALSADGRARLGARWFATLPAEQAADVLRQRCGLDPEQTAQVLGRGALPDAVRRLIEG